MTLIPLEQHGADSGWLFYTFSLSLLVWVFFFMLSVLLCQLLIVHGKMALQISFNVQFNCQLKDAGFQLLEICHLLKLRKKNPFSKQNAEKTGGKSILSSEAFTGLFF